MFRGLLVTSCATAALCSETLREGAAKHGIYFGTAINHGMLNDAAYTALAKKQYNLATAENACKWDALEPQQGNFTWSECDDIRDFALNEMKGVFRGHNLCWGNQLPSWTESLSPDGKRAALISHAKAVVTHYGTDAFAWDVVNEAVTDDNSASQPLKDNTWYPDVPDYIDVMFTAAREAAPKGVKLFYNDYNIDSTSHHNHKSQRVYDIMKSMVDRKVPVDGVGFQFHIGPGKDNQGFYDGFKANLEQYDALGLEVHITELDIAFDSWSPANEKKQADMYAKLLQICLDVKSCTNFETWGFEDARTWRSGKHPLPFDANFHPKAAVASMLAVLDGTSPAPTPTPTPSTRTYERLDKACQNAVAVSGSGQLSVSSIDECQAKCDDEASQGCTAFDTNGQYCYLKSHCDGSVDSASSCATAHCAYRLKGAAIAV